MVLDEDKNTADAILNPIEHVYTGLNAKYHNLAVFVDLKKAWDTVDHQLLIKKLYTYGIRGVPLEWFSSFLRERSQCVRIGSQFSTFTPVDIGVPQGSVLAPLLFQLFVNDMPDSSNITKYTLFADDTTLAYCQDNYSNLISIANRELDKLYKWTLNNRLSFNTSKTCLLYTSPSPRDKRQSRMPSSA